MNWRSTLTIPTWLEVETVCSAGRLLAGVARVAHPVPEQHAAKAKLSDAALVTHISTADVVAGLEHTCVVTF